uniref:Putative conserved secreted protein n=1 Tax=Amblyomma triste TaxID=251400 RepID=A0A023G4F2_AMBTT
MSSSAWLHRGLLACVARGLIARRSAAARPVVTVVARSIFDISCQHRPWLSRHAVLAPQQLRHKSTKSRKGAAKDEVEEEEDEDEDEEEEGTEYGDNERTAFVSSLRIDSIMKAGVNMPKMKVLECIYNGSIRLNGQKVVKKSAQVSVGDDVDYVLGFTANNPNLMEVNRVTLLSTDHDRVTDRGRFQVRLRCQRRLVIEKYDDHEE